MSFGPVFNFQRATISYCRSVTRKQPNRFHFILRSCLPFSEMQSHFNVVNDVISCCWKNISRALMPVPVRFPYAVTMSGEYIHLDWLEACFWGVNSKSAKHIMNTNTKSCCGGCSLNILYTLIDLICLPTMLCCYCKKMPSVCLQSPACKCHTFSKRLSVFTLTFSFLFKLDCVLYLDITVQSHERGINRQLPLHSFQPLPVLLFA